MSTTQELIADFKNKRILVIGDVIIDQYIYGTATGLSAETPTIVAKELETKTSIGGAFLLVRNLLELGAKVTFMSVVGEDYEGEDFHYHHSLTSEIFTAYDKRTTAKKRYWIDGYKLLQLDVLESPSLPDSQARLFFEAWNRNIAYQDKVIISDYRHGLMTPIMIDAILGRCKYAAKPVYVDSQISRKTYSESNYELYKGADVFCMNQREAEFTYSQFGWDGDYEKAFRVLSEKLGSRNIIVKLGQYGCKAMLYDKSLKGSTIWEADGYKVNTVDTCGAGDAFLAALSLCDIENAPAESLKIANAWAALSTTIHGTEPAKLKQLLDLLAKD